MKLLVAGGSQRSGAVWKQEWSHYEAAKLLVVDWATERITTALEYASPRNCTAGNNSNIVFKAGTLVGNTYYACTQTEVLTVRLPDFAISNRISLPCFNDVHHAALIGGRLTVVSTGLDLVIELDDTGAPTRYVNVLGRPSWGKFDQSMDYRKRLTTKPHESHPNFVFEIGGQPWVTRFEQRDAVCLSNLSERIDIAVERPHDGIVIGDHVYFTTVNGTVQVASSLTHSIATGFDLNNAYSEENPLGWCRGLHVEGSRIFVGFSSLRSTKIRENVAWASRGFRRPISKMRALPTRIVEFDTTSETLVKEVELSGAGLDAIFSIHKLEDDAA